MRGKYSRVVSISLHLFLAFIVVISANILVIQPASAGARYSIIDTLGAVKRSTLFQQPGSTGFPVHSQQHVGVYFELSQPTLITEVGTFVSYCGMIYGEIFCESTQPIQVQIRAAANGEPNMSEVLGTYNFHKPNKPKVFSYEAVRPRLVLQPGEYFAFFTASEGESANLLSSAVDPFYYKAGLTTVGFILSEGFIGTGELSLAVRILGMQVNN